MTNQQTRDRIARACGWTPPTSADPFWCKAAPTTTVLHRDDHPFPAGDANAALAAFGEVLPKHAIKIVVFKDEVQATAWDATAGPLRDGILPTATRAVMVEGTSVAETIYALIGKALDATNK